MKYFVKIFASISLAVFLAACSQEASQEPAADAASTETAEEFVARANAELKDLGREIGATNWVRATYITEDTAILASAASEKYSAWHGKMVEQALQYEGQNLDPSTRRALELLKLGTSAPAPDDAAKRKELAEIRTDMTGSYGAGKYCRSDNDCMSGPELEQAMRDARDYDELLEYWTGWREVAVPMREPRVPQQQRHFAHDSFHEHAAAPSTHR